MADAEWWRDNTSRALADLDEMFSDGFAEPPSYREANFVARDVLLVTAPLLRLDPEFGDDVEREQAQANLTRLCDLARRIFENEAMDVTEIEGARFVLQCFQAMNESASAAIAACRWALATFIVTSSSIVFEQMWNFPAPEAWVLAHGSYEFWGEATDCGDKGYVVPDESIIGLATAHRVSDVMRSIGGGETMSSN